ncbi:hypothetical protein DSO57_1022509, partial [Entomophthora muscae]
MIRLTPILGSHITIKGFHGHSFPRVAQPKPCHPGKPSPKTCLLAAVVDLNLMINCKWVVAQEIRFKWGTDDPCPNFPSLTCWSSNPDPRGGQ